jgi:thymidylate synthase
MLNFNEVYANLLAWVMAGPIQTNDRTGERIKVGHGGTSFRLNLADGLVPLIGTRKTYPKAAAAEMAWYISGSKDVTWLRNFAPFWNEFVEDDGCTIDAAYGYRWRKHFGRDQIACAIAALRADASDRRVHVSGWDPGADGLGAKHQRNVPCPTAFNLNITDGYLHMSLFIRSSDLFVGLPYDTMGFAYLLDALAAELGVKLGFLQATMANLHLYESHWDFVNVMQGLEPVVPQVKLPNWQLTDIEGFKDEYMTTVLASCSAVVNPDIIWPEYNPKPKIVK